jgi:hypothetical protein
VRVAPENVAHFFSALYEAFVLDDLHDCGRRCGARLRAHLQSGYSGGAADGVAAEGAAVRAWRDALAQHVTSNAH